MSETRYIDAYCHLGRPRFGTAEDAIALFDQWGIKKGVFVLGPEVPDYQTLFDALSNYGDRVRGIGIPFGETTEQIRQSVTLQLQAGVLGLRVQKPDLLTSPDVLSPLGEQGRWLYAIGFINRPDLGRHLLQWLTDYPQARLAAPHFLRPYLLFDRQTNIDEGLLCDLLTHPRFYPIFSRHGGAGSQQAYPHTDLRPWVEQVIALTGLERIMWGSEYPVYYWRDETMGACQDWLQALDLGLGEAQLGAFWGGNAQRLIFDQPPPPGKPVTIPLWVEAQFNRQRTVPLFEPGGLAISMDLYDRLHHRFVAALQHDKQLTFAQFVIEALERLSLRD